MEMLMEYMAKGFVVMLSISMPCVLVAASIGLVVGILQAVTQVQEQTIAAAPKILAVFLVIVIGGVGFTRILTNLFNEGVALAFNVVPKNEAYVLPADYYKYTVPFAKEMNDNIEEPKSSFKKVLKQQAKNMERMKKDSVRYQSSPQKTLPKPDFLETQKIMGK